MIVTVSPSGSEVSSVLETGVPAVVCSWMAVTVGASLTGVTVTETVAGADVVVPSEAVKVNESGPE